MTDGAVATIVTGIVTVATMLFGFLTLWVKLRYGQQKVEEAAVVAAVTAKEAASKVEAVEKKIDTNTELTSRIEQRANEPMDATMAKIYDNTERICALETEVKLIKSGMDAVGTELRSTRHEMRGHLQTIVTNMGVLLASHHSKENGNK